MSAEKKPTLGADLSATLRSQGRLFRALSRQSTDILFVLDHVGNIGFVGESSEPRLGLKPTDLIGTSFFDRVHPSERVGVLEKLQDLPGDEDSSLRFRCRYKHGDGRRLRLAAEAIPCEFKGRPSGVLLTVRDVTEESRKRRELQRRERWLRAITRNALDMLTILPLSGPPQWLGGSIESILGYEASELRGTDAWAPVHPDDLPRLKEVIDRCAKQQGSSARLEYRMQRKDGAHIHVETLVSNCLDDPHVRGLILNTRDITDRIQRDPLTGLANRRVFLARLGQALAACDGAAGRRVAVLVVDVDRFKSVNDSFGLQAGDGLLVGVAERLASWLRPGDTVARIGGDEFAMLFDGIADDDEVQTLAEGVQHGLSSPFQLDTHTLYASASLGYSVGDGSMKRPEKLLGNALTALNRAKAGGRGRRQGFAGAMRAEALREATMELDLHQALRRGELLLHYQPIIRLDKPRLVGLEALVRWRSESRGFVPPSEFIPAAEEAGLIFKIEEWVLRNAFRQSVLWRKSFPIAEDVVLAVNLSAKQLARPELPAWIDELLADTGADPAHLRIEVTESAFIDRPDEAAASLTKLKERGFHLALDDFGTGYASLAHLHRFPFDTLKIDQSFISGLGATGESHRLVSAIIAMAAGLGLEVVAEGIENRDQLSLLRAMGCRQGQGYLFSKAMSAMRVGSYFTRIGETTEPLRIRSAG